MADISKEVEQLRNAVYGEEVRGAFISCMKKIHEENENYNEINESVVAAANSAKKECEDIRIGVDGTKYDTAGEAVRKQIQAAEEKIVSVDDTLQESGKAADAKVVGENISSLKKELKAKYDTASDMAAKNQSDITTKLNKSGYTAHQWLQTDENGNIVAGEKPTYTSSEVSALPDTTHIPSTLAEMTDDPEHRTVTDAEKKAWNGKSDFSGSYNDLTDKPTVPTVPTALPNPQALTITYGGQSHTYDGSEALAITIETGGGIERVEKLATDTTVTLEPDKRYIFPEMASLTYTIGEGAGEVHFIFKSGATATRVVHPAGVNIGSFSVEANKIYEVSILEGLLTSQNWSVS